MKYTSLDQASVQAVSHNPAIQKKVMLTKGDLPSLTNFSQAIFPPGQVAQAHFHHDMAEVFFVQSGQGVIKINDQDFLLETGVCVAVEPGEVHEVSNTGTTDLVITYFGLQIKG